MRTFRRLGRRAAMSGAVFLLATACTPDTSSSDDDTDEVAVPSGTAAIPPERLTPFCKAMIELSDRLETDPPDDVEALIIETYIEIEDDVPPEIAPDFAAVLADLQGTPQPAIGSNPVLDSSTLPGTSTIPAGDVPAGAAPPDATVFTGGSIPIEGDDTSDEGYLPSDNPTARLSAYVDYTCGGSLNNPGPPATQPLDDVVPPTNEP